MTVLKLAIRGIRASLGRLALTTLAIIAGVGFVSGAFILADSLASTFNSIFENSNSEVDAQITVAEPEFGDIELSISDDLVDTVAALPEVGSADPGVGINDVAAAFVALDENGEEVRPQGPPVITFSWNGDDGGGLTLAEGTPPMGIGQTAIDSDYATALDASVGDVFTFNTPDGQRDFEIAAILDFEVSAGAYFVLFDFETAQTLYGKEGLVDAISLSRAPGVTADAMIAAVDAVLPPEAQVLDQQQVIEDQTAAFEAIISGLRTILLVFAGIALFVSLFIIYNTFAILVTQRLQQIGMLRAIGATRRQLTTWVLTEALVVGVIGSIIGLLGGFVVAFLIKAAFQASGGFPDTDTVLEPRTIWVALAVGILATLVSALVPAFLAARVSPVEAMRPEGRRSAVPRGRVIVGVVLAVLGAILMAFGLAGRTGALEIGGLTISSGWIIGIEFGGGAILLFVGVFLFSVLFAGPVVNFIGRPAVLGAAMAGLGLALIVATFALGDGVPESPVTTEVVGGVEESSFSIGAFFNWISFVIKMLVALLAMLVGAAILASRAGLSGIGGAAGRVEGHLARRNAARSPIRTAATAMALTIGIALVSTVSVVGQSLKASFASTLDRSINADLFIYDDETGGAFSGELADQLESVDGLSAISRFRFNEVRIEGDVEGVGAFNAGTGTTVIDFGLTDGSVDGLLDGGILVFEESADELGLSVGDPIDVEFPVVDGEAIETLTVSGIFEDNSVLNSSWVIDLGLYERYIEDEDDFFVGASIAEGADADAVKAEVLALTDTFSSVNAQDNQEFIESQEGQVDSLVTLINYLLGFALIVAFLGVINTIVLSVVERTREIGLLRAVGTTQKQIRAVVRWEAVIVCLFGALLGIALGVLFGWAAVSAIPDSLISDLALPFESVIFTILIAALAGVLAAVIPAFLAARRNVLESIATTT